MSRARKILEQVEMAGSTRVSRNPRNLPQIIAELRLPPDGNDPEGYTWDAYGMGFRFLIDLRNLDLYVWEAKNEVHPVVARELGIGGAYDPNLIPGFVQRHRGSSKWSMHMSFEGEIWPDDVAVERITHNKNYQNGLQKVRQVFGI